MYKTKGFTLVELVLVMSIMAIMAWMWTRYISSLDADRAYSESCTNALYSDLANWVYYASTSRVLSDDIVPDYYILDIVWSWYEFKYGTWSIRNSLTNTWILYLSRHVDDFLYCKQSKNYYNKIEANFNQISMLPALVPDWDQTWFKICVKKKNSNSYECDKPTWTINVLFCPKSDDLNACLEFWQVFFDARTWMVKKKLCKLYEKKNGSTKCKERSTWR